MPEIIKNLNPTMPQTGSDRAPAAGQPIYVVVRTDWIETYERNGRTITEEHHSDNGVLLRRGWARPGQVVTREHFLDREQLNAWLDRGCLKRCGTLEGMGRFNLDEWFRQEQEAKWDAAHRERQKPEPDPENVHIASRDVRGGITMLIPWVYLVQKNFDDFEKGEYLSPYVFKRDLYSEAAKRTKELAERGYIRVVAKWEPGRGFVRATQDDFKWSRGAYRMLAGGFVYGFEDDFVQGTHTDLREQGAKL